MKITPLVRLRLEAKVPTKKITEALGITRQYLYKVERGKFPVPPRYVKVMAKLYGVDPDDIVAAQICNYAKRYWAKVEAVR